MLLFLYLAFSIFMLHSALMSGSRIFAIFAIFLLLVPVCLFVLLLVQQRLTRVDFTLEGAELLIVIEKGGILPLSGLKYTVSFTYDQSGEGAVIKNTAASLKGHTEIVLYPELLYTGSGVFELKKCTVSDYAGFFRLPLIPKNRPRSIPIDLLPEEKEALLEPSGDPGRNYMSEYTKTVQQPGDDASETFDVREYRSGDRISRMHWKLTAKREAPMIREFSREDNARFLFVPDFGERTQENFDHIVNNYFNLAASLPEEESAHVLMFEDPEGDLTEIPVEDARELEKAILVLFTAFQRDSYPQMHSGAEKGRFTPHSAEENLEEYHRRFGARRFIREFIVTDEELSVLAERWNEDED